MAFGTNYARSSMKVDLVTGIKLSRSFRGMSMAEVLASVKGYMRKSVAEIKELAKEERKEKEVFEREKAVVTC